MVFIGSLQARLMPVGGKLPPVTATGGEGLDSVGIRASCVKDISPNHLGGAGYKVASWPIKTLWNF